MGLHTIKHVTVSFSPTFFLIRRTFTLCIRSFEVRLRVAFDAASYNKKGSVQHV